MSNNFSLDPSGGSNGRRPEAKTLRYSLGGHLVLGHATQVVAAAERGDAVGELVDVEADTVVPHHHAVGG